MCAVTPTPTHVYSADTLRSFDVESSCTYIRRDIRKLLFSMKIWSPRLKYKSTVAGREKSRDDTEAGNVMQGTRSVPSEKTVVSGVNIGVMNVCSLGSKLHYVIDHAVDANRNLVIECGKKQCCSGKCMFGSRIHTTPPP